MSITPAFSPGPWITQGALVGSVRRWIFEDLYEQCSFHIAEKMPSSVIEGARPISFRMRSYSSGLRPCSAMSCGVTFGSLEIMTPWSIKCQPVPVTVITGECPTSKPLSGTFPEEIAGSDTPHLMPRAPGRQPRSAVSAPLGGPRHVVDQTGEQAPPVGAAHGGFHVVFGMRHHAEHIAALIEDAGDRVGGAVVVPGGIERSVGRHVTVEHAALGFEPCDGLGVGDVVSFAVRDRHADHLARIIAAAEGRVGALDPQKNVAADEFELRIAHQHARQQPRLASDLATVA